MPTRNIPWIAWLDTQRWIALVGQRGFLPKDSFEHERQWFQVLYEVRRAAL